MSTNTHKSNSSKRLVSYGIVGISAFAAEFLSFIIFYQLFSGNHKLLTAQTLSFFFGLTVSFIGSRLFTFKKRTGYQLSAKIQIVAYLVLALTNVLASNLILHFLVEGTELPPLYAKIIVMGMVVLWNYVLFNRFIFRTKPTK